VDLARGVHASRAPRWREAVLDGSLHRARCAGCDAEIDVHRPFLYTDMARRQWVHVDVPEALGRWRAVEAEALAGFDRWSATSPLFATRAHELRVRVVFGVDELLERLMIWDAGCDDATIECAKLTALRERPDARGHDERLRVDAIDDRGLHVRAISADRARAPRAAWITPRAVVDTLDLATWRGRFPELFGRGFVSIDRWLAAEAA